ncbi:MAG: shikimate kinase [Pseudomonadales bacterium]|nr:shikimate kinase [Pseudomonadales bacterium]
MSESLILVGPMGAGKTTIGRLLASELKLPFKDIDHLVVEHAGADIPWIFDVEGEKGFRHRESKALQEALAAGPAVIATGGGIVGGDENRALLQREKAVILLYATVDQQFSRTAKDKNRPLLQKENPRQVLADLFSVREPMYRQVADLVIETGRCKPKGAVECIVEYWNNLV